MLKQGLGDVFQNLLAVFCVCYREQAENNQIAYSVIVVVEEKWLLIETIHKQSGISTKKMVLRSVPCPFYPPFRSLHISKGLFIQVWSEDGILARTEQCLIMKEIQFGRR